MSRQSSVILFFGPKSVGPWGDRVWRISGTAQLSFSATAQLVEGSTPYWIVSPTQPPQHSVRPDEIGVSSPNTESVIESILFLLGCHFGDEGVEAYLADTHNLNLNEDGTRELAPFYELADQARAFLAARLSASVRIGVVTLDDMSLVNNEVISELRQLGFDVDTFSPDSLSAI